MHHGEKNGGDPEDKEKQDGFTDYFYRWHGLWSG